MNFITIIFHPQVFPPSHVVCAGEEAGILAFLVHFISSPFSCAFEKLYLLSFELFLLLKLFSKTEKVSTKRTPETSLTFLAFGSFISVYSVLDLIYAMKLSCALIFWLSARV